jgi:hypothetical protein
LGTLKLVHVSPGRGGADPEPGGQVGERVAFPQTGEHQQGLRPGVQLPPARPDRGAVAADDPGHISEGPGRQRQRGTVEKHEALVRVELVLVDRLNYQGFSSLSGDTPHSNHRVTHWPDQARSE